MLWSDVLNKWEKGVTLKYPKQLKGRFQWNTSDGKVEFKQSFRTNYRLP